MANPFVHIELSTQNVAAAKSFYGELFDWALTDVDMGGGNMYTMIGVGGGTGGGMMQHPMKDAPSVWVPYAAVADIKAATEKARALGAHIIREPMAVMDAGWLSIFADPTGAVLGLWQDKAK